MTSKPGFNIPKQCVVTGGSGFVGQRLVEMLVERGATRVVSFDKMPKPKGASDSPTIIYVEGDLTELGLDPTRLVPHSLRVGAQARSRCTLMSVGCSKAGGTPWEA